MAESIRSITVKINGFPITLDCTCPPPKAEELFHILFLEEEIPKAPSHHKQQRWNKRRIQKRWSWKKGADREIYEKRADFLKKKWNEMKKHYDAHKDTLSASFLTQNADLQINDRKEGKETKSTPKTVDAEYEMEEMKALSIAASAPDDNPRRSKSQRNGNKTKKDRNASHSQSVQSVNEGRKLSKLEGKRKAARRKEKLTERIANGESLENLVDRQREKGNGPENEKDALLFGGIQNHNGKRSKSKKSKLNKKRHKKQMKLAEFVESTKHSNGSKSSKSNKMSLAAIQAEQKREETRSSVRGNSKSIDSSSNDNDNDNVNGIGIGIDHTHPRREVIEYDVNPLLSHSMYIPNDDHLKFRQKIINGVYGGHSVFSCIPCSVEPTNTLLVEASFIESLLMPQFTLSNGDGMTEIKRRLQHQFKGTVIEILPISERAYIRRQCEEFLLIQFQDVIGNEDCIAWNVECALTLYHGWKQQVHCNPRIEFVAKWFGKSYFLQHSHLWSEVAVHSMVTVYDHNTKYMDTKYKKARHCRCATPRIIYFPPFHSSKAINNMTPNHGMQCIEHCCCCMYYSVEQQTEKNECISNGDSMIWHGRKCTAESEVIESPEEYTVQIDDCKGKYVVARSSLQMMQTVDNTEEEVDAQRKILDDLSFVLYAKKFWNITDLMQHGINAVKLI